MIAIVGAGITGLVAGWELERLGADFVILEADDRAGGMIRSGRVDGRILEWGPQRTRRTPELARLTDALGLTDRLLTASPDLDLFVYREGRLHAVPLSAGALATSDVVGTAAKLRFLVEPLTAGAAPGERVGAYFRRKVGREIYETLVAPLFGGLYGSDPDDMDVDVALAPVLRRLGVRRSLLARLLRAGTSDGPSAPACSFPDGMQELPAALHRALAPHVRLSAPVRTLRRRGAGWRLHADGGAFDAEHVVLTPPAGATASIVEAAAPDLARAAAGLRYNVLRIVHLHADTDLRGVGFQVSFTERNRALRGVTFNDSLFGRPGVYTAYLGAAPSRAGAPPDDAGLGELAVSEFRACTGYDSRPLSVARGSMPAWDTTWRGLADVPIPSGLHVAGNWWSRPGLPGRFAEARRLARTLAGAAGRARASMVSTPRSPLRS